MIFVHTVLCSMLFFTAWYRIVKTAERTTRPTIRAAMTGTTMASLLVGVAPWAHLVWSWFPPYEPHFVVIVLLGAFCSVQFSTAFHWRFGPPRSFQKRC